MGSPRKLLAAGVCVVGGGLLTPQPVLADEPVFGFISTTDLLPEGKSEVEQWVTWKGQKAHGSFNLIEGRTEYSYGLLDDFQLSGYLIYDWTQAHHNGVDGTTTPPEPFSPFFPDPDANFHSFMPIGVAVEGIWRVMSPYTDPIGLAFYVEPVVGHRFLEVEARAIAQKNFFDDRLIIAANFTYAPEIRYMPPDPSAPAGSVEAGYNTNVETDLNFGLGVSYRFAPNWSLGWEFQNEREVDGFAVFARSHWMGNAFYTGPTLHFGGEHFFATLSAWEQLPWANNYMNQPVIFKGRDYDVDFENFRMRLKLGWYF